jgi:hypothetical protein
VLTLQSLRQYLPDTVSDAASEAPNLVGTKPRSDSLRSTHLCVCALGAGAASVACLPVHPITSPFSLLSREAPSPEKSSATTHTIFDSPVSRLDWCIRQLQEVAGHQSIRQSAHEEVSGPRATLAVACSGTPWSTRVGVGCFRSIAFCKPSWTAPAPTKRLTRTWPSGCKLMQMVSAKTNARHPTNITLTHTHSQTHRHRHTDTDTHTHTHTHTCPRGG